mmetsp:Transcript_23974/g.44038  ORF Transcript_23974/g.44038 Transcript_23974/m.44038 type:complete len:258 (+) Transcript_23974:65-838(+)
MLMFQKTVFLYAVLTTFLLQIFAAQKGVVPWLSKDYVVPMPVWLLVALLIIIWVPHFFEAAASSKRVVFALAFIGGLAIGALVWYWDNAFKVALVASMSIANALDRLFTYYNANTFLLRPPAVAIGAMTAIIGRHAVVEGVGLYLGWLFLFIIYPAVIAVALDEMIFRLAKFVIWRFFPHAARAPLIAAEEQVCDAQDGQQEEYSKDEQPGDVEKGHHEAGKGAMRAPLIDAEKASREAQDGPEEVYEDARGDLNEQ